MARGIRILLLGDSHLGFDLPVRPRTGRRRRGHDFLANYRAALAPALDGGVDVVVHTGDVFDHPQVDVAVAYQAYEPLIRIAERGVPVFIVPGNHERSRLPHARLVRHPHVHVFDQPRTVAVQLAGVRVAFSGFPFERRDVRSTFPALLERTGWKAECAAVRLLCVHHCIEGATVGPSDYVFRSAADVIRLRDVPSDFAAVLSGHIHRQQVLTQNLEGGALDVPVLYAGSIERTSYAEAAEPKGYMIVDVGKSAAGFRASWQVCPLPARPMVQHSLASDGLDGEGLESAVRALIMSAPAEAVLAIRVTGSIDASDMRRISGPRLRALAPPTMNVSITADALRPRRRPKASANARQAVEMVRRSDGVQLDLLR